MSAKTGGLYEENDSGESVLKHQTQPRPKKEKGTSTEEPTRQRGKKPAPKTEATGETS